VTGIVLDDILEFDRYELVRAEYRTRVLAHKRDRRVAVGEKVTMLFEDRETVRYQIQEMARVERIRDPEKIQDEIDAYGDLVPEPDELSATLFIEIPELSEVKPELDRLLGIDESVCLVIGEGDTEGCVRGRFDERQLDEDRISAVHYVRFPLTADQRERFASAERLRVRIDHANYRAEAEIGVATRTSLLRDLRGETPVLLDPATAPSAPKRELLLETGKVRAYRLARPLAAEHVIVEPVETSASLLSADPELLAELMALVQRFAREITGQVGSCRVTTRVAREGRPSGDNLQWHVVGDQGGL
jgi:diadenosine tetraphosphate (Ap4A) HIT family hydrolase